MDQKFTIKTGFMALTALVAWFAIILQFVLAFPAYLDQGRTLPGIVVQLLFYHSG